MGDRGRAPTAFEARRASERTRFTAFLETNASVPTERSLERRAPCGTDEVMTQKGIISANTEKGSSSDRERCELRHSEKAVSKPNEAEPGGRGPDSGERKTAKRSAHVCARANEAARYPPPLIRTMSASCSVLTRCSDSNSTFSRSSSRRRSRAAADFTAESRRQRSSSAAAWLRLPTARSFSRSVSAAFRAASVEVREGTGRGHGARVSQRCGYVMHDARCDVGSRVVARRRGKRRAQRLLRVDPTTEKRDEAFFPRRPAKTRDAPVGQPRPSRR